MRRIKQLTFILALIFIFGCNESESDLLKSKLYFEQSLINIEVEDIDSYQLELLSRLTNYIKEDIKIEYKIGDESMVEAYNKKHGTKFLYMPSSNFSLDKNSSVIKSGDIFSSPNVISLKNLSEVGEGNTYLIPVILNGDGVSLLSDRDVSYIAVKKPITINKVYSFAGKYLDIQLPNSAKNVKSVTYETLIYMDNAVKLSTIMGNEGTLIFRFGDTTVGADQIQIAGRVQFNPTMKFETKRWYHVAFTYDATSGMAAIYVNGEKVIDKQAGNIEFDLHERFCIGYAYDYDANRIWRGKMSECRLWTVARTEKQLRDNMMGVDPNSEGLLGYWKLNGDDFYQDGNNYYVKDQTTNGLDAHSRSGRRGEPGYSPGPSVVPTVMDMKVKVK